MVGRYAHQAVVESVDVEPALIGGSHPTQSVEEQLCGGGSSFFSCHRVVHRPFKNLEAVDKAGIAAHEIEAGEGIDIFRGVPLAIELLKALGLAPAERHRLGM